MSKSKWSADFRTKVAQEYLDGEPSKHLFFKKNESGCGRDINYTHMRNTQLKSGYNT